MADKSATVEDYLSSFPEDVATILEDVRQAIRMTTRRLDGRLTARIPASSKTLEDAQRPDVELTPGDLLAGLGDHRVTLDGGGPTRTREIDSRLGGR